MEASKQNRPGPSATFTAGGRSGVAGGGTLSAVGRLIERADALDLRAPELALVLGERAAALAEAAGADEQWIRAESLVVSARVRLGERPATVGRAVAALRAAEHAGYGDIAARLRIDLAVCARSLGVPLTGLAALRPVLTDPVVSPVHRAAALCHLVGCLAQIGRKAELDRVLLEADKLVVGDGSLNADTQLLVRALLRVGTAAHRRRHGDLTAAADAARTGLGFLEKLDNPAHDGGLVRIRLVLQLVSTMLDRGDPEMAYEFAQPMLAEPVRAAGVAPAGWLRLAVATRIHLPAGAGEAAIEQVREAVAGTDRHGLSAITSRLWLELAQLEERFGQADEAIACLYRSRAAEQLHARARRQACGVLAGEFGTGEPASVDLDEVLRAVPSRPVAMERVYVREPGPAVPDSVAAGPALPEQPAQPKRMPAWSFGQPSGREEPARPPMPAAPPVPSVPLSASPKPPAPREPARAWSFESAAGRAEVVETTALIPAIRDDQNGRPHREPPADAEPEPAGRRDMPDFDRDQAGRRDVPNFRPESGVRLDVPDFEREQAGRRDAPNLRPDPVGDRRRDVVPEPVREEPAKTKFSWAAVAEARLKETAAEREQASAKVTPAMPLAPPPAAEREAAKGSTAPPWQRETRSHLESESQPTTRHDVEHGSVAARSVLDRLGISAGGGTGGGRRRATDESEAPRVREEEVRAEVPVPPPVNRYEPDLAPSPRADDEPARLVHDYHDQVEPWLPRLRMPPSLEPIEDFGSWTPATAPFPESYARAIAEDEPPPDAGLAELLARALAEHQAGTASAAALVKQLGSQGSASRRGSNGHNGRNGHNGTD